MKVSELVLHGVKPPTIQEREETPQLKLGFPATVLARLVKFFNSHIYTSIVILSVALL
jgi:hypothetical protein